MTTSRRVDRLTYKYYTGQNGSVVHGPNCHNCMNELFHANKRFDVEKVYIETPTGAVECSTSSLVSSNGSKTPFTMECIVQDFLLASCRRCTEKANISPMSEAVKDGNEDSTSKNKETRRSRKNGRKGGIEMKYSLETGLGSSSPFDTTDMPPEMSNRSWEHCTRSNSPIIPGEKDNAMVNHRLTAKNMTSLSNAAPDFNNSREEEAGYNNSLPFLNGRKPEAVKDPMTIHHRTHTVNLIDLQERKDDILSMARLYFINNNAVDCFRCKRRFDSENGDLLVHHLFHLEHWKSVAKAGLVFSYSEDFSKLLELYNESSGGNLIAEPPKIPFVFATFREDCLSSEQMFNRLMWLSHSELIDDGFSDALLRMLPNLKAVKTCSLCKSTISCDQGAKGYLNHFLSPRHIVKAVQNNWDIVPDGQMFIECLSNYLKNDDRKCISYMMLELAARKRTFSDSSAYKHIFTPAGIEYF